MDIEEKLGFFFDFFFVALALGTPLMVVEVDVRVVLIRRPPGEC